jgi:hypothetical protein
MHATEVNAIKTVIAISEATTSLANLMIHYYSLYHIYILPHGPLQIGAV